MIIKFPKVCLYWHNPRKGICGIEDWVTDVEKGKYGYDLRPGAEIFSISNWNGGGITYHITISEVTEKGIRILNWMTKGWNTDDVAKLGYCLEDGSAFIPWKDGDFQLCIQPCESLYENYKMKDLLSGEAKDWTPKINKPWEPDLTRGEGIWYMHGGWRTKGSKYKDNINNFVAINEQITFDFMEEAKND